MLGYLLLFNFSGWSIWDCQLANNLHSMSTGPYISNSDHFLLHPLLLTVTPPSISQIDDYSRFLTELPLHFEFHSLLKSQKEPLKSLFRSSHSIVQNHPMALHFAQSKAKVLTMVCMILQALSFSIKLCPYFFQAVLKTPRIRQHNYTVSHFPT